MKYFLFYSFVVLFSCTSGNKTIKIKGSDTEVNLAVKLAETFYNINPGMIVSISGGGSGLGIASLLNGTTDLANSSRRINEEEVRLFQNEGIVIDSLVFAQDAIAFIVATGLPIDSISTTQLAAVLNGDYNNWQPLASRDLPINIYGRQSNSGTHAFVKNKLGIEFSAYAKEMNGNAQILEAIKADNSGIGYVGAGYVIHGLGKGIKVLSIYTEKDKKAISPLDVAMIEAGKYFFQRPLFQYYKSESYKKIKPMLDFEKSETGIKIIKAEGYYPIQ